MKPSAVGVAEVGVGVMQHRARVCIPSMNESTGFSPIVIDSAQMEYLFLR